MRAASTARARRTGLRYPLILAGPRRSTGSVPVPSSRMQAVSRAGLSSLS